MIIKPGYAKMEFELPDGSIIADIGSGHNPLPQASYCIERDFDATPDRGGRKTVIPSCKFIIADVTQGIPLPDKSCDFVVASHILEHIDDPIAFCKELSRIGKEGYIETPGPWQEWINNKQVHKWVVTNEKGILLFTRKTQFGKEKHWLLAMIIDLIEYNLFHMTTYHWIGAIRCRVKME